MNGKEIKMKLIREFAFSCVGGSNSEYLRIGDYPFFKLYIYIQIIIKISRETILKVFIIDPLLRLCVSLNTHSRYVLELLDPSHKELCQNLLNSPYY